MSTMQHGPLQADSKWQCFLGRLAFRDVEKILLLNVRKTNYSLHTLLIEFQQHSSARICIFDLFAILAL